MAPSNGMAKSGSRAAEAKSKSNGIHRKSNGTNGSSSTHDAPTINANNSKTERSGSSGNGMPSIHVVSTVFTILRFLFVDIPLTSLFLLLVTSIIIQHSYHTYVKVYAQAYRRQPPYNDRARDGFYPDFDYDMTYYNRQCDKYDITTGDANDLLVKPNATGADAADIMMKHGAVVVQQVLQQDTAVELRRYLESRHMNIQDELPWHEKFFEEEDRLALGLGAGDHPVVAEAIRQVGTHPVVRRTIEGILGPDPAVVEISTMTSLAGADDQGIHTDSDYFGSSLLYSRTFLHSYTMFISLQDTTARMGATTLCPGTHHCANPDMEEICLQNGNGAFEASSNGLTGKGLGVIKRGDAMMFNQNIWHRGAANRDPENPDTNRVMFILTFVTRNKAHAGDHRYQGLGTYYYQRWNVWGHTYRDLQDSGTLMQQPVAMLRSLGIWKPPKRRWGVTWIEHMARELGNADHFYAPHELPEYVRFMDKIGVPGFLQGAFGRTHSREDRDWESYLEEMMGNVTMLLVQLNVLVLGSYLIVRLVGSILGSVICAIGGPSSLASVGEGYQRGYVSSFIQNTFPVMATFVLFGLAFGLYLPAIAKLLLSILNLVPSLTTGDSFEEAMVKATSLLFPTIASVGLLILFHIAFAAFSSRSKSPILPSFLRRILITHGLLVLMGYGLVQFYDKSNLAKTATTKEIFTRPFAPVNEPIQHTAPTTFPQRPDVLIGTRFDADWLASFNNMLDYHPGNIRFNHLVQGFATLPPSLLGIAPKTIFDFVSERSEGMKPRFLLQSYADGYWMTMSQAEALEEIRRAIEMERDGLQSSLGKEVKAVLAESRFGPLRDTVLAHRSGEAFAKKWQEIILGPSIASSKDSASATIHEPAIKENSPSPSWIKLRHMTKAFVSAASRSKETAAQHRLRYMTRDLDRADFDPMILGLKVGDKVLGKFKGSEVWEEARIEAIQDSNTCHLRLLTGEYFTDVHLDEIRHFEPFTEGDKVQAMYRESKTWHSGTVVKAHPLGTYDIDFDDGDEERNLDRDLIVKEKYSNEPIFLYFNRNELPAYEVDDEVYVNFEGRGEYFEAVITSVNDDGTYDIEYTDGSGDEESGVDASMIITS